MSSDIFALLFRDNLALTYSSASLIRSSMSLVLSRMSLSNKCRSSIFQFFCKKEGFKKEHGRNIDLTTEELVYFCDFRRNSAMPTVGVDWKSAGAGHDHSTTELSKGS